MVWAGPGFALRAPQRAGDPSGLEEITKALSKSALDDIDREALLLGKWLNAAGIRPVTGRLLADVIHYGYENGAAASGTEIARRWEEAVSSLNESSAPPAIARELKGKAVPLWPLGGTLLRNHRTGEGLLIVGYAGRDNHKQAEKTRLNRGVPALAIHLAGDPEFDFRLYPDDAKVSWRFLAQNNITGFVRDGRLYAGLNPTVQGSTQLNSRALDDRGTEFGDTRMQPRSPFVRISRIIKLESVDIAPSLPEAVWSGSSKVEIPISLQQALERIPVSRFTVEQPEKFSSYGPIAQQVQEQTAGLEELPLRLEDYFEIIPATRDDPETVLFTYPPDPATLRLYREAGDALYVLRPGAEPLGADPNFHQLVKQVDPHHLEVFVNERIDAALLDKTAAPRLKGIHSMGLGYGNIDLAAAAHREIQPTYVGGDENPLRWATAEMAEALALAGRFDLLRRIEPATAETPKGQRLDEFLRKLAHKRGMEDQTVQQLLWAQLMRQMRRLDDAGRLVREDRSRGAGNGSLRTVEGHQLAADLKGSGIQTSLGLLPGSAIDVARWAALARAHGVHKLFYTGERYEALEEAYGLVHVQSPYGLLRQSDYVLRAPDGPNLTDQLVRPVGAGRDYPWLVDPARLALSDADAKKLQDSSLDGKTVGILGLGSIGSIAAVDLKPMGAHLLSVIGHGKKIEGIDYVGLPEMVAKSDVLILALPETDETKGILTPELLNGIDPTREVVIVNVGRGTAVGATPEQERAFADWLKAHPNVRYYTDVLRNEFLPVAEQPLLDSALAAQVFYSGHIASNTADPNGHRTRSAMGKAQFQNYQAQRNGQTPPNRVPMPASGLEEGWSVQPTWDDSRVLDAMESRRAGSAASTVDLKGVTLLVFDAAAGPVLARQLKPYGADLFAVAETPEVARALLRAGMTPDRIVGVVGEVWSQRDYAAVSSLIRQFASGASSIWKEVFLEKFRSERPMVSVFPVYDAEQMARLLAGLRVPVDRIQTIEQERAGMEESLSGEA